MSDGFDSLTDQERIALTYCAPHGIPLSVFLGRVIYPGEPMWEPRDMWAAIQWHIEQRLLCSGCGQPRAKSMVPEWDAPDYEVEVTRCWGCEAMQSKMHKWQESGASGDGAYFVVKEVTDGDVELAS